MVNYSIAMLANPQKPGDSKKAYAKAQITQELSLKDMSRRIASQTTLSRADVTAVLVALSENMIDALRAGNQVDFGDLGKFRLKLISTGAPTAEEFSAANITGCQIQFIPSKDLRNISDLEYNPVPSRAAQKAVLAAQKKGETTVDITPKQNPSSEVVEDDPML